MSDAATDLDGMRSLFLLEISEPGPTDLHVVVGEGVAQESNGDIDLPDLGSLTPHVKKLLESANATAIDVDDSSRQFAVTWPSYVGYQVVNEFHTHYDPEEEWEGNSFRLYSKSKFLDHIVATTSGHYRHPDPVRHWAVCGEYHIVHVASSEVPTVVELD